MCSGVLLLHIIFIKKVIADEKITVYFINAPVYLISVDSLQSRGYNNISLARLIKIICETAVSQTLQTYA
jgi:hypothetical protein